MGWLTRTLSRAGGEGFGRAVGPQLTSAAEASTQDLRDYTRSLMGLPPVERPDKIYNTYQAPPVAPKTFLEEWGTPIALGLGGIGLALALRKK